jgi:restriction system protein
MARQNLFSVLLLAPWWLSFVIAAGLFAALKAAFPVVVAVSAAFPFVAVGCYAAWKQLRTPNEAATEARLGELRTLPWEAFSSALVSAYESQGYVVSPARGDAADFELQRDGRRTLLACRRWKATNTGVGPLKALASAGESAQADACLFVSTHELSSQARTFAAERRITLVEGPELAKLTARALRQRKRAARA